MLVVKYRKSDWQSDLQNLLAKTNQGGIIRTLIPHTGMITGCGSDR
jgi:hypothetical protein